MGKYNNTIKVNRESLEKLAELSETAVWTIRSLRAENRAYEKELARLKDETTHREELQAENIRTAMLTRFLAEPGADWDSHVWNFGNSPEVTNADPDVAIQGLSRALADVLCWSRDSGVLDKVLGYYSDPEYSGHLQEGCKVADDA